MHAVSDCVDDGVLGVCEVQCLNSDDSDGNWMPVDRLIRLGDFVLDRVVNTVDMGVRLAAS
jgi:hypothetical protein